MTVICIHCKEAVAILKDGRENQTVAGVCVKCFSREAWADGNQEFKGPPTYPLPEEKPPSHWLHNK